MVKVRYIGQEAWGGRMKTCVQYRFEPGDEGWVLMEDAPGFLRRGRGKPRLFETVG